MRGPKEFSTENSFDRTAWQNTPRECHHRTSVQYCMYIQQNGGIYIDFQRVLSNIMMTSGNNYPTIAFPYQEVPNSVWETRKLYRLYDKQENPQAISV